MHIFGDCQAAIHVITQQNNDNYHHLTISSIRENLFDISTKVKSIKIVYCPAHKGIKENETADALAKIATKKAKTLEPTLDIKTETSKLTRKKWQRRWDNSPNNIYKDLVPTLCIKSLKQRLSHLKFTFKRGSSKIIDLKTGHKMLKDHKGKKDPDTKPTCDQCKVVETPSQYLLRYKQFQELRSKMMKNITCIFNTIGTTCKNAIAEILGEHTLNNENSRNCTCYR